jgi:DCN1-like protein 1/2
MSRRRSLNTREKRTVRSLTQFVSCSERDAIGLLVKTNWDVQAAAALHFETQAANAVDLKKIDQWFNTYIDESEDPDEMDSEGIEQLCADLGIDGETDIIVLAIAWKMEASDMGIFTKGEFQKGMAALGCESAAALKEKLPALRSEIADPWSFKKLYIFCHKFAVDPEVHKRNLPLDTAIAYWNLLLDTTSFGHLDVWLAFLNASRAEVKFISKDQWVQVLEFANTIDNDMGNFKEGEEWPVLLDDFVAYAKPLLEDQRSGGGEKKQ